MHRVRLIQILRRPRLLRDVERLGRLHLHPIRQFKRLDAGFEVGVVPSRGLMRAVEARQQVELSALIRLRRSRARNIRNQLGDDRLARVEVGALEDAVQMERTASDGKKINPEILLHLGIVKKALGDKEGAKKAFEEGATFAPAGSPTRNQLQDELAKL